MIVCVVCVLSYHNQFDLTFFLFVVLCVAAVLCSLLAVAVAASLIAGRGIHSLAGWVFFHCTVCDDVCNAVFYTLFLKILYAPYYLLCSA